MTRRAVATIACVMLAALLAFDLAAVPPNPYDAPALFALGSGAAPVGGFCGAPASVPGS